MGALIFDGFCDGILLYNHGKAIADTKVDETALAFYKQAEHVHRKQNIFPAPVADVHYTTWKRLLPVSKLRPLT